MIQAGDPAPDFAGETADGGRLVLADLLTRGPVVLFFYVKDFTPG
jgi:peroxiredoxin Q/BCP